MALAYARTRDLSYFRPLLDAILQHLAQFIGRHFQGFGRLLSQSNELMECIGLQALVMVSRSRRPLPRGVDIGVAQHLSTGFQIHFV